ncbi:MAG: biotin/lipoyl-binding protein, partial [Gammaproteobacteria bacterium]|nr:biotin/lipoyl-binding protein [Gammaproteobacteria bacterium]
MNFKNKLHSMIPTQPRNRQLFFAATIIGVALLTSASIFATGPNASPAKDAEKAWPVSVTSAKLQELHPSVSVFGKLEASRIARLRSDLVAQVSAVYVHEGDWVNQGDTLVELNNRESQLVVLERQADLKQHTANLSSMRSQLELEQQSTQHFQSRFEVAQAKLTRHRDLMEKRLISKSLLDEVVSQSNQASIEYRNHVRELTILPNQISAHEAQVAKAQALLEQAELDLAKTVIVAPFAGPVLAVHTAPGDHSNLSVVLVEIADASSFEVRIQVPDNYARQFQQAKQLNHSIIAIGDQGQVFTLLRLAGHVRAGQT